MIFPSQNPKLVYSFESLSLKPMLGNEVVYLTVLAPWDLARLYVWLELVPTSLIGIFSVLILL